MINNFPDLQPYTYIHSIPDTFDGGLTFIEYLAKIITRLNEVITQVNSIESIPDVIDDLVTAQTDITNSKISLVKPWDRQRIYALNDYVTKDGKYYLCTYEMEDTENWNAYHWTEVTAPAIFLAPLLNRLISDFYESRKMLARLYDSTQTYEIGDKVVRQNNLYRCETAITVPENWDESKWLAINITDIIPVIPTYLSQLTNDPGYITSADLNAPTHRDILTVYKQGGMFNTIADAIEYAETYCTTTNRVTIQIGAGVWNENIVLIPNPGIDFKGCGFKNTIVRYNTVWPDSPLHLIGQTTVTGIKFDATGTSYALHFDSQDNAATGEVIFDSCAFSAAHNAAVGLGLGNSVTLKFVNCYIESATNPAMYIHNLPTAADNQFLKVYNCELVTFGAGQKPVAIDNAFRIAGSTGTSNMYVSFANTHARIPGFDYRWDASTTKHHLVTQAAGGDGIMLLDDSINCNIIGLDYNKSKINFSGYFPVQSNQAITIPFAGADKYNWTCDAAYTIAGVDVKANVTMNAGQRDYVYASCNNATVLSDKAINLTVTGVPK